jgi:hypothetical protein
VYNVQIGHQSGRDPLMALGGIEFRGPVDTSMVVFDFTGTVELRVTFRGGTLDDAVVLPSAYAVRPEQEGNSLRFQLTQVPEAPRKLVLRVNGDWEEDCLHILTGLPEQSPPDPGAAEVHVIEPGAEIPRRLPPGRSVYYFSPGRHRLPRGLWVEYDLGAAVAVNGLRLASAGPVLGRDQRFRLECREGEGEQWTVVCEATAGADPEATLRFATVTSRFFRLILLGMADPGTEPPEQQWPHRNHIGSFGLLAAGSDVDVAAGRAVAGAVPGYEAVSAPGTEGSYGHSHSAESFFVPGDDCTLYLAPGAVLDGAVAAEARDRISICGRGILDGSSLVREPAALHRGKSSLIYCWRGDTVTVEGVTILDSPCWSVVLNQYRNAVIRGVNCFGSVVNADGFHMSAVQGGLIEDCFIRTTDDLFCAYHYGPTRDILVRDCVFWSDGARIVLLGLGDREGDIGHITFENLDILNVQNVWSLEQHGGAFYIRASGGNTVHDITLRNTRLEPFRAPAIAAVLHVHATPLMRGTDEVYSPGRVRRLLVEDLQYSGTGEAVSFLEGADVEHDVRDVVFRNVTWGGRRLLAPEQGRLEIRDHVSRVRFEE